MMKVEEISKTTIKNQVKILKKGRKLTLSFWMKKKIRVDRPIVTLNISIEIIIFSQILVNKVFFF